MAIYPNLKVFGNVLLSIKENSSNVGKTIRELSDSFALLNERQVVQVALSQEMGKSDLFATLKKAGFTREQRKNIAAQIEAAGAMGATTAATNAQAAATKGATYATGGFKAAWAGFVQTIKAHSIIALFTTLAIVIPIAIALFDEFNVTVEEHIEKLEELESEYDSTTSELEGAKQEASDIADRMRELQGIKSPTLIEQEELRDLAAANVELERRILLLQQQREELEKQKSDEAEAAWAAMNTAPLVGGHTVSTPVYGPSGAIVSAQLEKLSDVEYAERLMEDLRKAEAGLAELPTDRAFTEDEQKRYDYLTAQIANYKNELGGVRDMAASIGTEGATKLVDAILYAISGSAEQTAVELNALDKVAAAPVKTANDLAEKLHSLKEDANALTAAMDALAAGKLDTFLTEDDGKALTALLKKFPDLRDELTAYANGLMTTEQLQKAFNSAMEDFNTNAIYDGVSDIADACKYFGASSDQVLQKVQNLEKIIPGLTSAIYDNETGLLKVDSAALSTANSIYALLNATIEMQRVAATADYMNMTTSFKDLAGSAMITYGSMRAVSGIVKDEIYNRKTSLQGSLDELNAYFDSLLKSVDQAFDKNTIKSNKSSKTKLYVAEIDRVYDSKKRLAALEKEYDLLDAKRALLDKDDVEKQTEYALQMAASLRRQNELLNEQNNTRRALIQDDIKKLNGRGFEIDYDPASNELYVKNREHLNELTGKDKTATNDLRKEVEKLINSIEKMNDANVDNSLLWWKNLQKSRDYVAEIRKLLQEQMDEQYDQLQSLQKLVVDMIKQEREDEIDALERQSDVCSDIINKRKELLKLMERERSYNEDVSDKTSELAKLQARADTLKLAADTGDRDAALECGSVLEQIAQLQKDLDETQRDHFIETTEDALDKELKDFEDQQDAKIDEIRAFLNDNEALDRAAMDRLDKMDQALFDDLLSYALHYTDTTRAELEDMWDAATRAAERYGSVTSGMSKMESGVSNDDVASAMVSQMKYNAQRWHTASESGKAGLVRDNEDIAAQLEELLGTKIGRDSNGVWWIDGEKLFEVYHRGTPSVGKAPTRKQNETFAKLEDGEAVYTAKQQDAVYDMMQALRDSNAVAERLIDSGELYARMAGTIENGRMLAMGSAMAQPIVTSTYPDGQTPQMPPINVDASIIINGYADENIMGTLKNHPRQVAEIVARQLGR